MSIPPIPRDTRGTCHFTSETCERACGCFFHAYAAIHGTDPDKCGLPTLSRGCQGDPVVSEAHKQFMFQYCRGGRIIGQDRSCSRKAFVHLLHDHWDTYSQNRKCPRKSRKKNVSLSDEEGHELARLLGTPVNNNGSFERYQNIDEAMKKNSRVKQLVEKSDATCSMLHAWLTELVPALRYSADDCAPILPASTLKRRRHCADVRRGDAVWFHREPTYSSRRVSRPDGTMEKVPVEWKEEWFGNHTFMLDATSVCNKEGEAHESYGKVYSLTDEVFPPRLVRADMPISQSTSIMVYCVIHKHLGVVVGPDIMFTGTKLPQSKIDKEEQFADAGVKTWCAIVSCSLHIAPCTSSCENTAVLYVQVDQDE